MLLFYMVFRNTGIISWYLTYCFEMRKQKQIRIKSCKDILQAEKMRLSFHVIFADIDFKKKRSRVNHQLQRVVGG